MKSTPKTIQIYLPHGDPRGVRIAELTTRIVRVIEVPRELLDQCASMVEFTQVGVYFLIGQEPETDTSLLYVGQTGEVGERLKQHRGKMFWTKALVAVTSTNTLIQTHAQYLEWRSLSEAKNAGRYSLQNGKAASRPYIPVPLEADCCEIFDTIRLLIATLGSPVFEPLIKKSDMSNRDPELLFCVASDADGRGYYSDDGLVVLKGSTGRRENVSSIRNTSDARLRERLVEEGTLRIHGERLIFERDHLFSAPSTAAVALTGRTANGWIEWKNAAGKTLKELRETSSV